MNKEKLGRIIFIAVFAVLVFLWGINIRNSEETHVTGFYMDTYIDCTLFGKVPDGLSEEIGSTLEMLDDLFNVNKKDSDVSRINNGAGEFVEVSQHTSYLVSEAKRIGELSGRALDITIYPVVKAWGFTTGENRVPGPQELSALVKTVDVSRIEVDEAGSRVKIPEGFMIDLGAVAKGYAGDMIKEILEECGVNRAIINLGGNIVCVGSKSMGRKWQIGIQSPYEDRDIPGYVQVKDQAVVTSGLYERFFEENGVKYGHIMNPYTGYPVDNGISSVTIISKDGLYADALSTAIFVGGEELAEELRKSLNFEYVIFCGDGKVKTSEDAGYSYIVK